MSSHDLPLILTLDLGTTSVRALLFDEEGRAVPDVEGRVTTPVHTTTDGGAEIDPWAIVEATAACVDQALEQSGDRVDAIVAVACDTFWHNIVGLDSQMRPVTPLLTWADTRPAAAIPTLAARLDAAEYHARTGCFLHPSYVPAKIVWLQARYPDQSIAYWLSLGEWLTLEWFGERVVSVSMASGSGLFHTNDQTWDDVTLDALRVRPEQLSPLADMDHMLRGLRGAWATRWPQLAHIPWTLPIGDGAASNLGCGAVTPNRIAVMVATSAAMRAVVTADSRSPFGDSSESPQTADRSQKGAAAVGGPSSVVVPPGLWGYRADGRRALIGGALSNGGNFLAWLRDTLKLPHGDDLDKLEVAVGALPLDQHGLTWLPFLAGERSVGWRSDAHAALVGMTWATTPLDIYRAGLETVAVRLALIHDRLQPHIPQQHTALATGGALLGSKLLRQMVADALGQPLVVSAEAEASARGAALLTLEALGLIPSLEAVPAAVGETVQPDPARHTVYQAAMQRHLDLYKTLLEN